jgi:hypothetical protein
MFQLKSKKEVTNTPLSPQERIDWLLEFIQIQGQINPRPKKSNTGFELKKKND